MNRSKNIAILEVFYVQFIFMYLDVVLKIKTTFYELKDTGEAT